jgi:hypothetical protein
MPILERATQAPTGPDPTAEAIEAIRAALGIPDPSHDAFADGPEAAGEAYAEEESNAGGEACAEDEPAAATPAVTFGHGPIRLRGRPVGPARGA